jgi:hypothetical protein
MDDDANLLALLGMYIDAKADKILLQCQVHHLIFKAILRTYYEDNG